MRKTSYAYAFIAVALTLVLNILSATSPNWILVQGSELQGHKTTAKYGFGQFCERSVFNVPDTKGDSRLVYTDYECRPFPQRVRDGCEDGDNGMYCVLWSSAGYTAGLGIGFGALACLALIFGVSTHSRRRRIWRAVAGLVAFHALWQLMAFIIVTSMYNSAIFRPYSSVKYGSAYVMNIFAWAFSIITAGAVIYTGIAANKGHRWAAGNRAYRPIGG